MLCQTWQPVLADERAYGFSIGVGRDRQVHHVGGRIIVSRKRIVRVLENAAHQHARIVPEHGLGTVAMVNIKIDDGYPLQAAPFQRMGRGNRDIVEQTEPHRPSWLGMVSGRPHGAEGTLCLAVQDAVDRMHGRTDRTQGRLQAMRIEPCVTTIDQFIALCRRPAHYLLEIDGVVYQGNVLLRAQWRVALHEQRHEASGQQVVRNGIETPGTLGVPGPHLVT